MTVKTTLWVKPPPAFPATDTVYVPVLSDLTFRIDDALLFVGTETLPLLKERLIPEGDDVADRLTAPENPFKLVTVIVEEAELFTAKPREEGFAEIEKSETLTLTVVNLINDPLTAVTLTR